MDTHLGESSYSGDGVGVLRGFADAYDERSVPLVAQSR
jgi:hypothetical protein